MKNNVQQTFFFAHPVETVWEYLTHPDLIAQWLTPTDFQPIVGHPFSFTDKSGKIIHCKVLEVQPPVKLSYSWQYASALDQKYYDSKVTWTLVPKENGTELHLIHNGFTALEDIMAHTKGWNTCLTRFEEQLNPVKK